MGAAASAGAVLLQFVVSIIIAGVLLVYARSGTSAVPALVLLTIEAVSVPSSARPIATMIIVNTSHAGPRTSML